MQSNETDTKLISILSSEIQRDGGVSLVRDLKDYDTKINLLLKRCSNTKLLAFLENYPCIFEVDRKVLSHTVFLLSDEYCDETIDALSITKTILSRAKDELKDRIVSVLRKQASRDVRRNFRNTKPGVNSFWLQKQCQSHIHHYLRLSGYYKRTYSNYKDVKVVGSDEWNNLVATEFDLISQEVCECSNGRACLLEDDSVDVETLAAMLTEKVEADGGTHISLALLLHRYPDLQKLLSGCDLIQLKEDNNCHFSDINIFVRNHEIYLQSKKMKEGRMEVDQTGLFSVASSKWGKAFASIMAKQCLSVLSKESKETIAIDLTASVGGITLHLAKAFLKVVAVEIDEHRAALCRKNMLNHGVAGQVDIRNEDSVEIITNIAKNTQGCPKIVVVDPPWGGMYYKSEKDQPIMMGQWSLLQVIERISKHLSPTIIGLRLPTSFQSLEFFRSLRNAGVIFDIIDERKAGPQLFIILSV